MSRREKSQKNGNGIIMKVEVLVSAVEQDAAELVAKMNIHTDAVLVNQCGRYGYEETAVTGGMVKCLSMPKRGVGLSRNTALLHAEREICLFSDEDIVLTDDYEKRILQAYQELPEADMILVNVKVAPSRKTYWNQDIHRISYRNYGRYPAYSITAKVEALKRANVYYSVLFGGGARYSNGEDSLFLRDCLKAGLRIYAHTICIGEEIERKSTWFSGYHEKFFKYRGVLYHFLYGKMALPLAFRFLWVHRRQMCQDISLPKAFALMRAGIREGKGQ